MARLERNSVQPPAAFATCIECDPSNGFLVTEGKPDGIVLGMPVIRSRECGIRRLNAATRLNKTARVVCVPASIGVECEDIARHSG